MRVEMRRKMEGRVLGLATALLALVGPAGAQDAPPNPPAASREKTLYARMGGYDVLAGVTDDFLAQMGKDPAFKRFIGGRSLGALQRSRQLIVDQVCNLTGGPCIYFGREMKPSHQGLAITQAEWDASIVMLKNALNKFKVGEAEHKEFLAIIENTRKDIVEPPKM